MKRIYTVVKYLLKISIIILIFLLSISFISQIQELSGWESVLSFVTASVCMICGVCGVSILYDDIKQDLGLWSKDRVLSKFEKDNPHLYRIHCDAAECLHNKSHYCTYHGKCNCPCPTDKDTLYYDIETYIKRSEWVWDHMT